MGSPTTDAIHLCAPLMLSRSQLLPCAPCVKVGTPVDFWMEDLWWMGIVVEVTPNAIEVSRQGARHGSACGSMGQGARHGSACGNMCGVFLGPRQALLFSVQNKACPCAHKFKRAHTHKYKHALTPHAHTCARRLAEGEHRRWQANYSLFHASTCCTHSHLQAPATPHKRCAGCCSFPCLRMHSVARADMDTNVPGPVAGRIFPHYFSTWIFDASQVRLGYTWHGRVRCSPSSACSPLLRPIPHPHEGCSTRVAARGSGGHRCGTGMGRHGWAPPCCGARSDPCSAARVGVLHGQGYLHPL